MAEPGKKVSLEDMRNILGMKPGGGPAEDIEKGKALLDEEGRLHIYESTLDELSKQVTEKSGEALKPALVQTIAKTVAKDVKAAEGRLDEKYENTKNDLMALAESVRVVEIRTEKKATKLKGVQHNQFQNLLKVVQANQPVLLVGPAGTGKTHGAALAAEALGLSFHSISVGSQTSKSDLQGYMDANGNYRTTEFRKAYEHGGVFLLDEADAGNSNVLILLNAALSNGYMAFPDGMIKVHEDFRMVATANTYGHGASRQYVGRNQLDAATLDRFVVINWDIDARIEEALAGHHKDWLKVVRAVRKRVIEELDLRVVVSPRATLRGALLLDVGMPFDDVLQIALLGNMPASERGALESLARAAWTK